MDIEIPVKRWYDISQLCRHGKDGMAAICCGGGFIPPAELSFAQAQDPQADSDIQKKVRRSVPVSPYSSSEEVNR